jgi:hypothetical protein
MVIGAENPLGMGHHWFFSLKAILELSVLDDEHPNVLEKTMISF